MDELIFKDDNCKLKCDFGEVKSDNCAYDLITRFKLEIMRVLHEKYNVYVRDTWALHYFINDRTKLDMIPMLDRGIIYVYPNDENLDIVEYLSGKIEKDISSKNSSYINFITTFCRTYKTKDKIYDIKKQKNKVLVYMFCLQICDITILYENVPQDIRDLQFLKIDNSNLYVAKPSIILYNLQQEMRSYPDEMTSYHTEYIKLIKGIIDDHTDYDNYIDNSNCGSLSYDNRVTDLYSKKRDKLYYIINYSYINMYIGGKNNDILNNSAIYTFQLNKFEIIEDDLPSTQSKISDDGDHGKSDTSSTFNMDILNEYLDESKNNIDAIIDIIKQTDIDDEYKLSIIIDNIDYINDQIDLTDQVNLIMRREIYTYNHILKFLFTKFTEQSSDQYTIEHENINGNIILYKLSYLHYHTNLSYGLGLYHTQDTLKRYLENNAKFMLGADYRLNTYIFSTQFKETGDLNFIVINNDLISKNNIFLQSYSGMIIDISTYESAQYLVNQDIHQYGKKYYDTLFIDDKILYFKINDHFPIIKTKLIRHHVNGLRYATPERSEVLNKDRIRRLSIIMMILYMCLFFDPNNILKLLGMGNASSFVNYVKKYVSTLNKKSKPLNCSHFKWLHTAIHIDHLKKLDPLISFLNKIYTTRHSLSEYLTTNMIAVVNSPFISIIVIQFGISFIFGALLKLMQSIFVLADDYYRPSKVDQLALDLSWLFTNRLMHRIFKVIISYDRDLDYIRKICDILGHDIIKDRDKLIIHINIIRKIQWFGVTRFNYGITMRSYIYMGSINALINPTNRIRIIEPIDDLNKIKKLQPITASDREQISNYIVRNKMNNVMAKLINVTKYTYGFDVWYFNVKGTEQSVMDIVNFHNNRKNILSL